MGGWIHIRNWEKYQHYGNRRVPWIKLYTELLWDDDYMSLTPAERSALTGLWLLYAETRQRIPEDTAKVSRALGQRFTKKTLISLSHAGFIEVSSRQPSRPEVEVEKEKESTSRVRAREPKQLPGNPPEDQEEEFLDQELVMGMIKELTASIGMR